MGQLPIERYTPNVYPFTFVGIDYFGPMYVTIGRRREKRWGALFTCLTTRALHLEIVPSLDTNSCILAIIYFMSIRGVPKKIFSDNGTNFVGAERELRQMAMNLDHDVLKEKLSIKGIGAPHFGGCWERDVRSVKAQWAQSNVKQSCPYRYGITCSNV